MPAKDVDEFTPQQRHLLRAEVQLEPVFQGEAQRCEQQTRLGPCLLVRGSSPRVAYERVMG